MLEVTEVTETDKDEAIEDGERLETLLTVGAAVVTETAVRVVPDPTPMGPELDPPEDWRLVPKVSFLRILLTLPGTISLGDTFPDTRLESEGAFD